MKNELAVIPKPVSVKYAEGTFRSKGLPPFKGDDAFRGVIETASYQMKDKIDNSLPSVSCEKIDGLEPEAYNLEIKKDRITAQASSPAGMYHALQTIRQLSLSHFEDGELVLPCAKINDYPRFSWRGLMLDCSRYYYSVPFIKNLIDVISMHHINKFHWHLTDDQGWRLPVPEYPLLTEVGSVRKDNRRRRVFGGIYSDDEIKEVIDYAASRHIETIPEVDLPGHACAILTSYPSLGCTGGKYHVEDRFGIFKDVLCAGNDQIFDLAEKVFETLARLFPSKYVHIGGDEVPPTRWKACPKCKKRLEELGLKKPAELQSWITVKLVQMLSKHGKTAIGWDEILEDTPGYQLPNDAVVMSWRGSKGGKKASKRGHNVIMTPNTEGCYLDYKHLDHPEEPGQMYAGASTVYISYSMDPAPSSIKKEDASHILGGQGNLWSELIYAGKFAEYMIFPRLCAIAEAVWTPRKNKDFEDFSQRLIVHRQRLDCLGVQQYRGVLR